MGLFDKFRQGLKKTVALLNTDIRDLLKREGRLVDEEFLSELFAVLVKTDMGVEAAKAIVGEVRANFRGRVVFLADVIDACKPKLKAILAQPEQPLRLANEPPTVIMVCGVNGSGKTTSIAKLAYLLKSQGKSVILGAADTFRAAAVEQLTIWADRLGVEIVTAPQGSDPASVAHRAASAARDKRIDICIIDTAGRLQTQHNLMQELGKIYRVLGKVVPGAPHEILLVMDATTGQNGISQAKHFTAAVACSGMILAKLDGSAKGGVVVAIRQQVDLPVKFVGVGERLEDLAPFDADSFVDALFADVAASP
jgi:fused signal recognition particle receptor